MRKIIILLMVVILFPGAIVGGVYAYKETTGMSNAELFAELKYNAADMLITLGSPDTPPASAPKQPDIKKPGTTQPATDGSLPAAADTKPAGIKPDEPKTAPAPAKVITIEPVTPEKQKARELIKDANTHFDAALEIMKKSYDYDGKKFFEENQKALDGFRKACRLYEEASELDPENDWLNNRLREAGKHRATCFKQGSK